MKPSSTALGDLEGVSDSENSALGAGAVAGICVAAIIIVLLLVGALWRLWYVVFVDQGVFILISTGNRG